MFCLCHGLCVVRFPTNIVPHQWSFDVWGPFRCSCSCVPGIQSKWATLCARLTLIVSYFHHTLVPVYSRPTHGLGLFVDSRGCRLFTWPAGDKVSSMAVVIYGFLDRFPRFISLVPRLTWTVYCNSEVSFEKRLRDFSRFGMCNLCMTCWVSISVHILSQIAFTDRLIAFDVCVFKSYSNYTLGNCFVYWYRWWSVENTG